MKKEQPNSGKEDVLDNERFQNRSQHSELEKYLEVEAHISKMSRHNFESVYQEVHSQGSLAKQALLEKLEEKLPSLTYSGTAYDGIMQAYYSLKLGKSAEEVKKHLLDAKSQWKKRPKTGFMGYAGGCVSEYSYSEEAYREDLSFLGALCEKIPKEGYVDLNLEHLAMFRPEPSEKVQREKKSLISFLRKNKKVEKDSEVNERKKNELFLNDHNLEMKIEFPNKNIDSGENFEVTDYAPFLLNYGNEFSRELMRRSNKDFSGTKAVIPLKKKDGIVYGVSMLQRSALISTLSKYEDLKSENFWPVTPAQSEEMWKNGTWIPWIPNNFDRGEEESLALILYDISTYEGKKMAESILGAKEEFGVRKVDLESPLVVVNSGLKRDEISNYGVSPIVLPGVTQVYTHEIFEKMRDKGNLLEDFCCTYGNNKVHRFDNSIGTEKGLPKLKSLKWDTERNSREIYIPKWSENGLLALCKTINYNLMGAEDWDNLSSAVVTFLPQKQIKSAGKKKRKPI